MKTLYSKFCGALLVALVLPLAVLAQNPPTISYHTPNIYTAGTAISPLTPASTNVWLPPLYKTTPTSMGGFNLPFGIAVDLQLNRYITNAGSGTIQKQPYNVATSSSSVTIASGFNTPTGIAIDADGNLYIAEFGANAIKKLPAGGGAAVTLGFGFNQPTGVAVDADGNVYVADKGNNAVKVILAATGNITTIGSGFTGPAGVAVDAAGNVYVADYGSNSVKKIPVGGGATVTINSTFSSPQGIAVDDTGNIFVSDNNNNAIKEIAAGTTNAITLSTVGYNHPAGIAIDKYNRIDIADYNNSEVSQLTPNGGYWIGAPLPAGLTFNNASGVISGTPTAGSLATDYLVSAYKGNQVVHTKVNIKVTESIPPTITALNYQSNKTGSPFVALIGNVVSLQFNTDEAIQSSKVTIGGHTVKATHLNANRWLASYTMQASDKSGRVGFTINVTDLSGNVSVTYNDRSAGDDVEFKGNVATLQHLGSTAGNLSPAFSSGTNSYTATVSNTRTSITVTPTVTDSASRVKVNNVAVTSGTPSAAIPLNVGNNPISIKVTSADGSVTNTYTLTANRAPSTNDKLLHLRISKGTLSPDFDSDVTSYTASVSNGVTSLNVAPTTAVTTSTITINGTPVASKSPLAVNLSVGTNVINTVILAEDGSTSKTYTITITRAAGALNSIESENVVINSRQEEVNVHPAISPNGDGVNDFLIIDGISTRPENSLRIISRTGTLVFQAQNYNNSQNVFKGYSNQGGGKLTAGTYYYALDYKEQGIARHKTGYIVIKY